MIYEIKMTMQEVEGRTTYKYIVILFSLEKIYIWDVEKAYINVYIFVKKFMKFTSVKIKEHILKEHTNIKQ